MRIRTRCMWSVVGSLALLAARAAAQCEGWLGSTGYIGAENQVFELVQWDPDGSGPQAPVLVVGGQFTAVANEPFAYIAALDRGRFIPLDEGFFAGPVYALLVHNGDLYAGGGWYANGVYRQGVVRWNTALFKWEQVGADFLYGGIATLSEFNGDIVVGGNFLQIGATPAISVARWNGAAWVPIGTGVGPDDFDVVSQFATYRGDLYAGGYFYYSGDYSKVLRHLARWDGTNWQPVSVGLDYDVFGLAADDDYLYVGGRFTIAGGQDIPYGARWNGSEFSSFGSGFNAYVWSFLPLETGEVVVGGSFSLMINGEPTYRIGKWSNNTGTWSALESEGLYNDVHSMALFDGVLYIGGKFDSCNGRPLSFMARWDGALWRPVIDRGVTGYGATVVYALSEHNGDLIAGGVFDGFDGVAANSIARRAHGAWENIGGAFNNGNDRHPNFFAFAELDGMLYAGGRYIGPPGISSPGAARWDETQSQWFGMGAGGNHNTLAVSTYQGSVYYGGLFSSMDGQADTAGIARWDGAAWHSVAGGIPGGQIWAMTPMGSDLIVAGRFNAAGGVPAKNIARWDGSQWHALGDGVQGTPTPIIKALAVYNGQLYAGGDYTDGVWRWDGTTWANVGYMPQDVDRIFAMAAHDGYLFIGGNFYTTIDGVQVNNVARYDGTTWDWMLGGTNNQVFALRSIGDELWVGGTTFSRVGAGTISPSLVRWSNDAGVAVASQPQDQIVAAGTTTQFRVRAEGATQGAMYAWRRNGTPLVDGPTGAGGELAGTQTHILTIHAAQPGDSGTFDCVITQPACGSVASAGAVLSVVPPLHPGDVNCDGAVTFKDIDPFVARLGCPANNPSGCNGGCPWQNADANNDGSVDFRDIDPFVGLLGT